MRFWIIEDALGGGFGHYKEYIRTFKKGFDRLGIEYRIFGSKEAEPWLCEELGIIPSLPKSIWHRVSKPTPRISKLFGLLTHGASTYKSLNQIWRQYGDKPDWIFVPSTLPHHLLGWLPWLAQNKSRLGQTKILFFFPNPPVFVNASGTPRLNPDPTAKLLEFLLRRLKTQIEKGKVVLGAETRAMVEALSRIFQLPFQYYPHPVEIETLPPTQIEKFIIGAYGGARHEKGSDVLQKGIKRYLQRNPETPFHFAIQWVEDFDDENGNLISKDPELLQHERVEYITDYFTGNQYYHQLAQTSAMLLPYRDSYRLRVSRIVIEAMLYGMPVIASMDTTLFQQAKKRGIAQGIHRPVTPKALFSALEAFEVNHKNLKSMANKKAGQAKDHFSVQQFLRSAPVLKYPDAE